jgi:hypothetical protein
MHHGARAEKAYFCDVSKEALQWKHSSFGEDSAWLNN